MPYSNPGSSVALCVPYSFVVPAKLNNDNTPGTIYTFTANDGTSVDTKNYPPTDYGHYFSISSCGALGADMDNTFYIKVNATNP